MTKTGPALYAALLALACGACDSDASPPATANGGTAGNGASAGSAPAANGTPGASRPLLRLTSDGLLVAGPGTQLAFGMAKAEAVVAVTAILGQPTDQGSNQECGAGPMEFVEFGPLALNFQDGAFVGWFHSQPARTPPLTTATSVGIGTARDQIVGEGQGPLQVSETSLGTQFEISGINGLLSGPEPNATVTSLWAGTNCIFE